MMDIKSQIAPKGLEFKSNEFIISDKYACILTVISYPKFIYPGYLSSLTSMSGIKVVIKHIPLPFSSISRMLNKELADLKQRFQEEKDKTIQERIRNLINNFASAGLTVFQTNNDDLRMILDNFLNGGQTTTFGTVLA